MGIVDQKDGPGGTTLIFRQLSSLQSLQLWEPQSLLAHKEGPTRLVSAIGAIKDLLTNDSLYSASEIEGRHVFEAVLTVLLNMDLRFDSYCPECRSNSTFLKTPLVDFRHSPAAPMNVGGSEFELSARYFGAHCTRMPAHHMHFALEYFQADKGVKLQSGLDAEIFKIVKIGQWPNTAKLAQGELSGFGKAIDPEDKEELGKAIGLSAHDSAIGAYVYLRRVFERMVQRAELQWQEQNPDSNIEPGERIEERILRLRGILPEVIVTNRATYQVLSAGIHELSEDFCKDHFGKLKKAIIYMLEEQMAEIRKKNIEKELSSNTSQMVESATKAQEKDRGGSRNE